MSKKMDTAFANWVLDLIRAGGTLYLRLFNGDRQAGGTEISGGGYAGGVAVTFGAAASGRAITNTSPVTFPQATATLSPIGHATLAPAATGAIARGWDLEISPTLQWNSGETPTIPAGFLSLKLP